MILLSDRRRYIVLSLLWTGVVIAADQGSKRWAIEAVNQLGFFDVTPFLRVVLTLNPGISFGFLADSGLGAMPLIGFAVLIIVYLLWLWWQTHLVLDGLLLMTVIGGAIGNIIDRVRFGAVVDFIDLHYQYYYHWPAFNVADSAVVVGILLFVWRQWRAEHGTKSSTGGHDVS